jgi:hypothetical protein
MACAARLHRNTQDARRMFDCRMEMKMSRLFTLSLKTNSVALVREQTIPTELPPLVGELHCLLNLKYTSIYQLKEIKGNFVRV